MFARHIAWIAPLLAFAACADERTNEVETASPAYDASAGGAMGETETTALDTPITPAPMSPPATAEATPLETETAPLGKPVPASAGKEFPDIQEEPAEAPVTTTPDEASVSEEAREFVRKASVGGMFEVQSSQLALERATSPAVQDTAKILIRDHQQANDELRSIAMKKAISVPSTLDSEHQQMLDQLRNLEGDSFDKEFHRMQVDAHEKAIELFEGAAQALKEPELKDFAQKTLPTLKGHLDELKANPIGG